MPYQTIWTDTGLARRAAALAGGAKVVIIEMAVGDGGGVPAPPVPAQVALVNEVARYGLNALSVTPPGGTVVMAEAIVPAGDGPFTIREIGLFDALGDLVAVADTPEIEKAVVGDGALMAVYLRCTLEVVDPDLAVTLIIDPAVVMASREYVDEWATSAQHYAWVTFR